MKSKHLNLRIKEEIKEMLKLIAKNDNRNLTSEIEILIIERYDKLNKLKK